MIVDILQTLGSYPMLVTVLVLTVIYIIIYRSNQPGNIPPVPVRPYPFLGHTPMLAKDPRKVMQEWRKKAGDVFSIYKGRELSVVLNSYDIMKEAFIKQGNIFSDRPVRFHQHRIPNGMKGVIWTSGEEWKEQRTVSLSILREFGMGKNFLAVKVDEEVDAFLGELSELRGRPNDIRTLISNCVANVICNIIFGKRFELGDPDFSYLLNLLNDVVKTGTKTLILDAYPWLYHLPGDPFEAHLLVENQLKIQKYFIEHFIEPLSKVIDDNEAECYITAYLQEMKKKEDSKMPTTLDIGSLTRNIFGLFAAGSETTSTTILWFILEMMHNSDILRKIQKEIDEVVGTERRPNLQDRTQMNYLNAAIMEVQRRRSIVPFSVQHACNQTTTLGGYTIPKGTIIIPNLDSVLLDENIWKNPLEFNPERFLGDSGNLLTFEQFVPFSLGRRVCLGESLAKMELFLFLSRICQRFNFQTAEKGKLPPLKDQFGATAPPEAYEVKFIERF